VLLWCLFRTGLINDFYPPVLATQLKSDLSRRGQLQRREDRR
jgi:hypothetical protein